MLTCPACGTANPEGARFCNGCGGALAGPGALRKERKVATALFADLVGSTALAEREDPEIVQSVIGLAFDRIAAEISRHEGLLEKFMGDAVLAVFGVPRAHEDDAERAVRAAIEMQAVLAQLNRRLTAEGKPTLALRIGIEAGEVLVDLERATGPRDRMITGDAVNTAARLQAAAEPGHIVVGPGVHASTKEVIEYRELGPFALKGKGEPVPAWRALRIRARTRGERPRLGLEARLIGREEELAVMEQTLRRVETEGRPALLTIVGPAGVGKSRLVSELERLVEDRPDVLYWRRGRCLAYGNPSYSAFAEAIKAQCEIAGDDPAEVAARKADAALAELACDERLAPALHALVGAAEARGARAARSSSTPGGASSSGWPPATRSCSPSRTSTGPTTVCSTSSSTWRTGRRGRSSSSRPPGPSCSICARAGAGASATRSRSRWTRCRARRARRCSTSSCTARSSRR
jgi:class 3 adenylate cyclase